MNNDLTHEEMEILNMISNGKNISEIARYVSIPILDLDLIIGGMMHKTGTRTWEELAKANQQTAGNKIAVEAKDFDELTKDSLEAFCDYYDKLIEEHKAVCTICYEILPGLYSMCDEHGRLLACKSDWMDKLIIKNEKGISHE